MKHNFKDIITGWSVRLILFIIFIVIIWVVYVLIESYADPAMTKEDLAANIALCQRDFDKYNAIGSGMNYEQVKKIMESPGTKIVPEEKRPTEMPGYIWEDNGKVIFRIVHAGFNQHDQVISKNYSCLPISHRFKLAPAATFAKYNEVEKGMSYNQVEKIMGAPGLLISADENWDLIIHGRNYTYQWWGKDDAR